MESGQDFGYWNQQHGRRKEGQTQGIAIGQHNVRSDQCLSTIYVGWGDPSYHNATFGFHYCSHVSSFSCRHDCFGRWLWPGRSIDLAKICPRAKLYSRYAKHQHFARLHLYWMLHGHCQQFAIPNTSRNYRTPHRSLVSQISSDSIGIYIWSAMGQWTAGVCLGNFWDALFWIAKVEVDKDACMYLSASRRDNGATVKYTQKVSSTGSRRIS